MINGFNKNNRFTRLSARISRSAGNSKTFLIACLIVAVWAITGPVFEFSNTWQLFINTGTTIVTFLMVFLIQSTQNRDTKALHIKLDELIRVTQGAHTALLDLEELSEQELVEICRKYEEIAERSRAQMREGKEDKQIPDMPEINFGPNLIISEEEIEKLQRVEAKARV